MEAQEKPSTHHADQQKDKKDVLINSTLSMPNYSKEKKRGGLIKEKFLHVKSAMVSLLALPIDLMMMDIG